MMGGHCRTAGQPHVYSRLHQLVITQEEDDVETEHLDDVILAGTEPIPDYVIRMRTVRRVIRSIRFCIRFPSVIMSS